MPADRGGLTGILNSGSRITSYNVCYTKLLRFVIVEYGVSINAVAQSAKEITKYNVEKYTGLKVGKVNVSVQGVRIGD